MLSREKFGVHSVDFTDPNRPRTPKESSKYLKSLAEANAFVETDGPCSNGQQWGMKKKQELAAGRFHLRCKLGQTFLKHLEK